MILKLTSLTTWVIPLDSTTKLLKNYFGLKISNICLQKQALTQFLAKLLNLSNESINPYQTHSSLNSSKSKSQCILKTSISTGSIPTSNLQVKSTPLTLPAPASMKTMEKKPWESKVVNVIIEVQDLKTMTLYELMGDFRIKRMLHQEEM